MAQSSFYDLVRCFSPTTGPGSLTIGSALPGFLNFTTGGVVSGAPVTYVLLDGLAGSLTASETGQGIPTFAGGTWTLTRATVRKSTNGNAPIMCTGNQVVVLTLAAEDLAQFSGFAVGKITGTLTADGSIGSVPAGAVIIGGKIAATAGVTVSFGSTSGGSDLLPATTIAGAPDPGAPLQGLNFLKTIFAADQSIFVHLSGSASVTATVWYLS